MSTVMIPIFDLTDVKRANANYTEARQVYDDAATRVQQCDRQMRSSNAVERLMGETNIRQAKEACATAELAMIRAQHAFDQIVGAARQQRHAERHKEQEALLQPHLVKLRELVETTAPIIASQMAERDEDAMGTFIDPLFVACATEEFLDFTCERLRTMGFGDVVDAVMKKRTR